MLRVGIMCRGESFHAWQAWVIRDLIGYRDISIELLIMEDRSPTNVVSLLRKISRKNLFWQIFYRLSSRKMTCDKIVDMKDELKNFLSELSKKSTKNSTINTPSTLLQTTNEMNTGVFSNY